MLTDGRGIAVVPAAAAPLFEKACQDGDARACGLTGVLDLAQGIKPMAMNDLRRACTMTDQFACAVQKRVK